jgi:hypothetical protein
VYALMEANDLSLVESINRDHVTDYDWLVTNVGRPADADFQARYRRFWMLNAARLGQTYCDEYFQQLASTTTDTRLEPLVRSLYEVPVNSSGRKALQFSFASKLLHMRNRHLPIYDSQVAAFYFYSALDSSVKLVRPPG